jgi:adenylate kinase
VVLERLSSRRVCEGCGRNYSVSVAPGDESACEACGGRLVQRDDDKPDAIKRRLDAYRAETVPTIEWFDSKGLLVTVDGNGAPEEVTKRLLAAIDERLAAERG